MVTVHCRNCWTDVKDLFVHPLLVDVRWVNIYVLLSKADCVVWAAVRLLRVRIEMVLHNRMLMVINVLPNLWHLFYKFPVTTFSVLQLYAKYVGCSLLDVSKEMSRRIKLEDWLSSHLWGKKELKKWMTAKPNFFGVISWISLDNKLRNIVDKGISSA